MRLSSFLFAPPPPSENPPFLLLRLPPTKGVNKPTPDSRAPTPDEHNQQQGLVPSNCRPRMHQVFGEGIPSQTAPHTLCLRADKKRHRFLPRQARDNSFQQFPQIPPLFNNHTDRCHNTTQTNNGAPRQGKHRWFEVPGHRHAGAYEHPSTAAARGQQYRGQQYNGVQDPEGEKATPIVRKGRHRGRGQRACHLGVEMLFSLSFLENTIRKENNKLVRLCGNYCTDKLRLRTMCICFNSLQ